jgi:hypothetical protein
MKTTVRKIRAKLRAIKWWNFNLAESSFALANHKQRMIHTAFRMIKRWRINGSYLEFGTFKGQSIIYAYKEMASIFGTGTQKGILSIHGFDSFAGIKGINAEEISGPFIEGGYSASLEEYTENLVKNNVDIDFVKTHSGFFQNTLTLELLNEIKFETPIAAVINIDCDVFEPAFEALNFCKSMFTQGTIVLFDDYYSYALHPNKGEVGALSLFCSENPEFIFNEWMNYGPQGKAFIVSLR